jgi:alkyl hydroperoxide reductase subunit AhpC
MEDLKPHLPELQRAGVQVVNVSIDSDADAWRRTIAERAVAGVHLLSSAGSERQIAQLFGVEAVPQYFIISKSGVFADKPLSNQPEELKKRLLDLSQHE